MVGLWVAVIGFFGCYIQNSYAENHSIVDNKSVTLTNLYSYNTLTGQQAIASENTKSHYTIIVTSAGNGRVTPEGITSVKQGAVKSFTFLPETGYHISALRVDGELFETVDSYTFMNISSDHTIEVIFADNNESPNALANPDRLEEVSGVATLQSENNLNTDGVISAYLW